MFMDLSSLNDSLTSDDSDTTPGTAEAPGFSNDVFEVFPTRSTNSGLLTGDNPGASTASGGGRRLARKSMSKARTANRVIMNPDNFPEDITEEDLTKHSESDDSSDEDAETVEDMICIDLFEDDADSNYNMIDSKYVNCDVCDKGFSSIELFKKHHRRHMAPELFQCPKCKRGFTNLSTCLTHETKVHGAKKVKANKDDGDYEFSDRYVSTRSTVFDNSDTSGGSDDEAYDGDRKAIIPSTTIQKYQGPRVPNYAGAIDIEIKQSKNRDRGSALIQQISEALHERNMTWCT